MFSSWIYEVEHSSSHSRQLNKSGLGAILSDIYNIIGVLAMVLIIAIIYKFRHWRPPVPAIPPLAPRQPAREIQGGMYGARRLLQTNADQDRIR